MTEPTIEKVIAMNGAKYTLLNFGEEGVDVDFSGITRGSLDQIAILRRNRFLAEVALDYHSSEGGSGRMMSINHEAGDILNPSIVCCVEQFDMGQGLVINSDVEIRVYGKTLDVEDVRQGMIDDDVIDIYNFEAGITDSINIGALLMRNMMTGFINRAGADEDPRYEPFGWLPDFSTGELYSHDNDMGRANVVWETVKLDDGVRIDSNADLSNRDKHPNYLWRLREQAYESVIGAMITGNKVSELLETGESPVKTYFRDGKVLVSCDVFNPTLRRTKDAATDLTTLLTIVQSNRGKIAVLAGAVYKELVGQKVHENVLSTLYADDHPEIRPMFLDGFTVPSTLKYIDRFVERALPKQRVGLQRYV